MQTELSAPHKKEFFVFADVLEWSRCTMLSMFMAYRFPSAEQIQYAETFLRMPPARGDLVEAAA